VPQSDFTVFETINMDAPLNDPVYARELTEQRFHKDAEINASVLRTSGKQL